MQSVDALFNYLFFLFFFFLFGVCLWLLSLLIAIRVQHDGRLLVACLSVIIHFVFNISWIAVLPKSYSVCFMSCVRGIVPITCDELFKAIDENTDKNKVHQERCSLDQFHCCVFNHLIFKKASIVFWQHSTAIKMSNFWFIAVCTI